MRTSSVLRLLLLLPILVSGCVVLRGQRLLLVHDEAADRLTAIVCYDGVYDSPAGEHGDAVDRLRQFVASGNVLLFDWWGELKLDQAAAEAAAPDTPPRLSAFLERVARDVDVETLGHYRDVDGRVGAAQEVRVERVSGFLDAANGAISEAVLSGELGPDSETMPATSALLLDAAGRDHRWLGLEGHAVVVRIPAQADEWRAVERAFLRGFSDEWARDERIAEELHRDWATHLLATASLSIEREPELVTLRLGTVDRPTELRVPLRDDYANNLESEVTRLAPLDLDTALAERLLGESSELPRRSLEHALPEDEVRAVLSVLERGPAARREAAAAWLDSRAQSWGAEHRYPAAPPPGLDGAERVAAWAEWYRAVVGELEP
jgi:hypothetical protein